MNVHHLKVSLTLIISSAIISYDTVASNQVYIVSSPDQPCPGQATGEQCPTLQQYITGNYTTNFTSNVMQINLELLQGIHIVQSNSSVLNISSLEVNGTNATIFCSDSNNSLFTFERIGRINIHGLMLKGCMGALFNSVGVLTIQDTHFQNHGPVILNSVSDATIIDSSLVNGRKLLVHSTSLLVRNTTFLNLTVEDNYSQCYQDQHGGALRSSSSNITIEQCIFINNSASCMNDSSKDSWGGAVYANNSTLDIIGSKFTGNLAAKAGGAISADATRIQVNASTFSHCTSLGEGGAIYIDSGTLLISKSSFNSNKADYNGGVIYTYTIASPVTIDILYSDFSHNQAVMDGGVMYVRSNGGLVTVRNSTFAFNNATGRGGVIAINGSQLFIDQATTLYNNAAAHGGVISACRSNVTIPDGFQKTERNNSACSFYDEYISTPTTPATTSTISTTEAGSTSFPYETATSEATTATATTGANTTPRPGTNSTTMGPHLTTTGVPPNPNTTKQQNVMPTVQLDEHDVMAIYATLSIAIVVCVLLTLLYIIVMCIVLYLCGAFKSKKRKVNNPYVYVPMNENESAADNGTASK